MKNILMTLENCETANITLPVVEKTLELANAFSSKVWLLHVAPPSRPSPYNVDSTLFRQEIAAELRHEHECLRRLATSMREKHEDISALLVQGPTIDKILEEAERLAIDLVVSECHTQNLIFSALMNDTDENLLARCPLPILFVPN